MSSRVVLVALTALFVASCGKTTAAPEIVVLRDGVELRVDVSATHRSVSAAAPEPLDLATMPDYTVEILFGASRRNVIGGPIAKICADLVDRIERIPGTDAIRATDEIRWVVYDGKQIRARVPEGFTSVFCEDRNVLVLSEASDGTAIVYRFSRDAAYLDAMRISTAGMRASHSPGSVVSLSLDQDRLFLLWSASAECDGAADPTCWAYAIRWAADEPPAS